MTRQKFPYRFGPYVLVQGLGMGEMGTVALGLMGARNRERLCVVKQLRPHLVADRKARQAAEREINIARSLSHGGIAQTFSSGEEDGVIYLVQEYIEGWSLHQLMNSCNDLDRWPSIALSCYIAREVARALSYLHSADGGAVVHRDIAPSNIMLSFTGEVKLIDFGIAKSIDDNRTSVVGRYTYGAPEMRDGKSDPRSDLYGLAVVLWALLAHDSDPNEALRDRLAPSDDPEATIERPPAPSNLNPEVPPELDDIVLRALSFLPEDRYQTAVAFTAALGAFIPPDFVGDEEIRRFFKRHTHPEERHQMTLESARAAVQLLDDPTSRAPAAGEIVVPAPPSVSTKWFDQAETALVGATEPERQKRGRRWIVVIATAAAAAVAAGVLLRPYRPAPSAVSARGIVAAPASSHAPSPSTAPPPASMLPPTSLAPLHQSSAARRGPRTARGGEPPVPAAELLALAESDLRSDRLDQALSLARRALAVGAGADAHVLMGRAFMKKHRLDAAEGEFTRALAVDSSNVEAQRGLEHARQLSADVSSPSAVPSHKSDGDP